MSSRRALVYIPGHDWKKIIRVLFLSVNCICMDMEDGVALNRKANGHMCWMESCRHASGQDLTQYVGARQGSGEIVNV